MCSIIITIIWHGDLIFRMNDEKLSSAALKQGLIFPEIINHNSLNILVQISNTVADTNMTNVNKCKKIRILYTSTLRFIITFTITTTPGYSGYESIYSGVLIFGIFSDITKYAYIRGGGANILILLVIGQIRLISGDACIMSACIMMSAYYRNFTVIE